MGLEAGNPAVAPAPPDITQHNRAQHVAWCTDCLWGYNIKHLRINNVVSNPLSLIKFN